MTDNSSVLKDLFSSKALGLVDRAKETKQLMYALATREHMLLMGKPGTAKSQFAINAFNFIKGAEIFQIHLTKQTTEEYVFGPLNIVELKKGNLVHNTKNSILTADFAFLDEFFDASDVLLRSLLGVLNERIWLKGSQKVKAKLHTAILTSNYQRESNVTEAILDRIIFKCEVQPISIKSKRMRVYKDFIAQPNFLPVSLLTLKELHKISTKVDNPNSVKFGKDVLEAYDKLVTEFAKETNKYISIRTANKALKVVKASALMDQRDKANFQDLEDTKYVFCILNKKSDLEEEIFDAVFERCVGKIEEENQSLGDISLILKKLDKIPANFDNLDDKEFVAKIKEINEYIHLLEQMATPTQKSSQIKEDLIDRLRSLIANNKDKLFNKK